MKARLRLPVDCAAQINDGTVERLLKWHGVALARATSDGTKEVSHVL
jgi:hypothetical protein